MHSRNGARTMIVRVILLTWLPVLFAVGFVKAETSQTGSTPLGDAKEQQRSISALQADVSAALTAEAKSRRVGDNTRDVLRLIELYCEMAAHPQHDSSASLKELGLQVRSRLVTVRDRVERRISDPKRSVKNQKIPRTADPETRVLAQQAPPGRAQVGQGALVTGLPRAAGIPADLGPDLVELIQATISPATWNINGGNGSIVYYAPLHVLVVSAPDEVHGQIGGVLRQMQAAQRQIDGVQVVAEVAAVHARN